MCPNAALKQAVIPFALSCLLDRAGGSLYYFEVIDCGRRILLTGALIFIAPNTATQAAVACMFAFASLLGFELLRPHLDPVDSWLYRLVSDYYINTVVFSLH